MGLKDSQVLPSLNNIPSLPRNVKVKAEVNSFSIESESENGIFLFILFTPGQRRVLNDVSKKDGSKRFAVYYRPLSDITKIDGY